MPVAATSSASAGRSPTRSSSSRSAPQSAKSSSAKTGDAKNDAESVHTVKRGETAEGIAKDYGVGVANLERENQHIRDMDSLNAGQELRIPPPSAAVPPAPASEAAATPAANARVSGPQTREAGTNGSLGLDAMRARAAGNADKPQLQRGAKGAQVSDLQRQLESSGFSPGKVDGKFGPKTQAAVGRFQTANGLKQDGIAGKDTWGALGKTTPARAKTGLTGAGADPAAASAPTIRKGDRGSDVADLQRRLEGRGFSPGGVDGQYGAKTKAAVKEFQKANGLRVDGVAGKETWGALPAGTPASTKPTTDANPPDPSKPDAAGTPPATNPATDPATTTKLPYTPNEQAMKRARESAKGKQVLARTKEHAATYKEASRLTGVPASVIGAIHSQESAQGSLKSSVKGPESGFGLDPRHVTSKWGNQQLARYGLGKWERGTGSEKSKLQSAVVAGEHFKRMGRYAGVKVGPNMTRNDLAAASTAYVAGIKPGKRAKATGDSWMFRTTDPNPHPYHPGGTSVGRGGRIIRVAPSRKAGLLRWDTLLPLVGEGMG